MIFWKKLLENKEMVLKNGVKNIQATAYNGARTVIETRNWQAMAAFGVLLHHLWNIFEW